MRHGRFLDVSTEYLLGRSDIRKVEPTKQAVSDYLSLTEEALEKIKSLSTVPRIQQSFLNDFKMSAVNEPLLATFNTWVETINLQEFLGNIYNACETNARFSDNEYVRSKEHLLQDKDKQDILYLQNKGYAVLPLEQQIDFYTQTALHELRKSIEKIMCEAIHL